MKFLGWYVKIGAVSALVGASMEVFMIKTGFFTQVVVFSVTQVEISSTENTEKWKYDKVTVLESEKLAWENSPEAQAVREALNPWRNHGASEASKDT